MARIPSTMIPLGTKAPDFALPDVVSGKTTALQDVTGKHATVVMFLGNHCPFVKHIQDGLIRMTQDYLPRGISFVAISSNDAAAYPDDGPEKMKAVAEEKRYPFPYLYDETQEIASAYHAACTPDFYLFDRDLRCVYRGQFDDSRPGNGIPVTGQSLSEALDQLLAGEPVDTNQRPSLGCNIKWKT